MKYKAGDFLKMSWGYDQTNVDFFKVVRVMGRMIEILHVENETVSGHGTPMEYVVPSDVPGRLGRMKKRPAANGSVRIYDWRGARAYPWNGKPAYETGAMFGH